jgi:hypothetical protein
MPGLVPGIHVLLFLRLSKDVDGRDKPGHDDERVLFDRQKRVLYEMLTFNVIANC